MSSFTVTETTTFTLTHARHLASKVSADLKRMQRFYGEPSDLEITRYETELIEMLKAGYLGTLTLGYKRDGAWIEPTLRYTARDLAGSDGTDDDPGRVRPGANISNATFYNYMTYSAKWNALSDSERDAFKKTLPFCRGGAPEPSVNGYLEADRTYSSGGRSLNRSTVRSYS
jgi:hypothetical protein